jgi:ABC-2 type transport system ATP-binding protein
MQSVLELDGLRKSFGDTLAVKGLTLTVARGEIVGLIGPDGAGKTTTMRMVAGLITPTAGSASILGHDVATEVSAIRPVVGYMPQQFSLYGDLSVEENLRFFAGMYGVPKATMIERERRLLGIARLEEFRDRPAGALSGGMYKKLALSTALIHEPRLLLLDEPTNGVDPISRRELWALLKELVGSGVGVLISTPYMDEAERCDRVGLLVDGELVALDSPAGLKAAFADTILELTTEKPLGGVALVAGLKGVTQAYTVGRKIHLVTADPATVRAAVSEALGVAEVGVTRIEAVAPSFEDIFLGLSAAASTREVRS